MRVEERGRVHLPRRAVPVEREGERQPAGLRAQLLLADIVAPAAAGLADAAAHHQEIDDPPVVHVHVVPVIEPGPEDHHRAAVGLLGVPREFAGDRDDVVARHAGDLFRPGRRVGLHVVVGTGARAVARARGRGRNWRRRGRRRWRRAPRRRRASSCGRARRAPARPDGRCPRNGRARGCRNRESRHRRRRRDRSSWMKLILSFVSWPLPSFSSRFHLPCSPQRKPADPRGTTTLPLISSRATVFHSGLFCLAERACEVGGAKQPLGNVVPVLLHEPHQHRHVGVAAAVVLEIGRLPVEMELAQHHMAERHGERGVGALLGMEPQVGELRSLRIIRRDHDRLWRLDSAPRYRNARRACASAARSSPRASGSPHYTSRPIPARRSARPMSAARPAAGRNTSRRRKGTRRRAATGSAIRPRRRSSTWPGSARSRRRGPVPILLAV